ncbi:hypothetical protein HKD37_16G044831 [Glycine soja]
MVIEGVAFFEKAKLVHFEVALDALTDEPQVESPPSILNLHVYPYAMSTRHYLKAVTLLSCHKMGSFTIFSLAKQFVQHEPLCIAQQHIPMSQNPHFSSLSLLNQSVVQAISFTKRG